MNEAKVMSEAEQTQQLERYMSETKKALKTMSKNDLIKAVTALLLEKQVHENVINRLQTQLGTKSQKENTDAITSET